MGGMNRDFDGNAGVNAVLVTEIDASQVEALQPRLTGGSHICWIATCLHLPIHISNSELGCQFHLLSHPSLQSLHAPHEAKTKNKRTTQTTKTKKNRWDLSENGFVVEGVEDISGVEEGDAGVDSVVDESDYVFFGIGIGIEDGHVDATQALRAPTLQSL
jgi:hypothetical protein